VLVKDNDIDRVLSEMECIASDLINDIKEDSIFAFKTTNYYYLFHYEPGLVIAQIELKAYDRNLKNSLKSIFTTLQIIRKRLKNEKIAMKTFDPLRLLDSEGSYTGISFSKKDLCSSIKEGAKSPKYIDLIGISIVAYWFSFASLDDYLMSIKPTLIVTVAVYFVQVIQRFVEVYNKEIVRVE
jgi:hypothetical protein